MGKDDFKWVRIFGSLFSWIICINGSERYRLKALIGFFLLGNQKLEEIRN